MAEGKGSGGVSARQSQKKRGGRGEKTDQITRHLQEVYQGFASEDLPDNLRQLVARLEAADKKGGA